MSDKPIWVFSGMDYAAAGGLDDCVGRFASVEEAIAGFWQIREDGKCSVNWWHIVDVSTATVLRSSHAINNFHDLFTECAPDADPMAIFELTHGSGI